MKRKKLKRVAAAPAGPTVQPADQLAQLREEQRKITADRAETYEQVGLGWEDAPPRLQRLDLALADIAARISELEQSS
jgi:hypothetical protein